MRKFVALFFAAAMLFAACEQKSETTTESADTVAVPEAPATDPGVQPMSADTTAEADTVHTGH